MSLTREEDDELRRLDVFERHGLMTEAMARIYDDLRKRDRRRVVREDDFNWKWMG